MQGSISQEILTLYKSKGLPPCSQDPATGPYHEYNKTFEYNAHSHTLVSLRFTLSSHSGLRVPSGTFRFTFSWLKAFLQFSFSWCVLLFFHHSLLHLIALMTHIQDTKFNRNPFIHLEMLYGVLQTQLSHNIFTLCSSCQDTMTVLK
jgi:hypothetical protein